MGENELNTRVEKFLNSSQKAGFLNYCTFLFRREPLNDKTLYETYIAVLALCLPDNTGIDKLRDALMSGYSRAMTDSDNFYSLQRYPEGLKSSYQFYSDKVKFDDTKHSLPVLYPKLSPEGIVPTSNAVIFIFKH
jgi:hypothetical protein